MAGRLVRLHHTLSLAFRAGSWRPTPFLRETEAGGFKKGQMPPRPSSSRGDHRPREGGKHDDDTHLFRPWFGEPARFPRCCAERSAPHHSLAFLGRGAGAKENRGSSTASRRRFQGPSERAEIDAKTKRRARQRGGKGRGGLHTRPIARNPLMPGKKAPQTRVWTGLRLPWPGHRLPSEARLVGGGYAVYVVCMLSPPRARSPGPAVGSSEAWDRDDNNATTGQAGRPSAATGSQAATLEPAAARAPTRPWLWRTHTHTRALSAGPPPRRLTLEFLSPPHSRLPSPGPIPSWR